MDLFITDLWTLQNSVLTVKLMKFIQDCSATLTVAKSIRYRRVLLYLNFPRG